MTLPKKLGSTDFIKGDRIETIPFFWENGKTLHGDILDSGRDPEAPSAWPDPELPHLIPSKDAQKNSFMEVKSQSQAAR